MSKGDTTIRVDMEVAGASSVKMKAEDVFKSMEAGGKKLTAAQIAENKKRLADEKAAAKERTRLERRAEDDRRWAQREAAREEKWQEHERIRQQWHMTQRAEEDKRRSARETAAEKRRIARQEQNDAKRRMREEGRDAKKLANQRGMVDRVLHAGAMGIAGYAGVSGVASMFSSVAQGMQQFISKRAELEKAIAPIVMLEDNVSNMGKIRQEVSGTAVALGRSYQEVGQFYSELIGTTGNLNQSQRDQLVKETKELADLTGGSLVTAQNLLTKSYQIFGKEVENVNQLQNKLMMTQDQASISFEEMGQRLPEVLQAGQLAGVTLDEVLATTIGATRRSGSVEKTMTGQRNFYLILEEAQKKGITLTGTYMEKVEQLAGMFAHNKDKMMGLFDREVVIHAKGITDALVEMKQAAAELGTVTGETDMVFDKLMKKASDPAFQQSKMFQILDSSIEDAPNIAPDVTADSPTMRLMERMKQGELNFATATSGMLGENLTWLLGSIGGLLPIGYSEDGRAIAKNRMELPDLLAADRVDFFRKKEADMEYWNDITMGGRWYQTPENIAKRKEIESRQLSPHLMTEEERRIYKETGVGPQSAEVKVSTSKSPDGTASPGVVEDIKTHDLLKEQNRLLELLIPKSPVLSMVPGGGKNQAEETL